MYYLEPQTSDALGPTLAAMERDGGEFLASNTPSMLIGVIVRERAVVDEDVAGLCGEVTVVDKVI